MRILLDTQIFLWFITNNDRLASRLAGLIRDPANQVFLSSVSVWETIVKYQLGKLPLPESPETLIPTQRNLHRFETLSLDEASATRLVSLPRLHRDPFDRMLICQALEHGLVLATVDDEVRAYPVSTV